MALVGSGTQVGSANQFGIGFGGPNALVSDGTTVYMFHARRGYTVDPTTGIAVQVGGNNLGASTNPQFRAAMYHDNTIYLYGLTGRQVWSFDPTDNTVTAVVAGVSIAGSASVPIVVGMTSLNGIVYVAESFTDALMTMDIATGVLTPVDADTVSFGLASANIQSLGAYKGQLIAVNLSVGANRMVALSETDGVATVINDVDPPDTGITGIAEHNDELLAVGTTDDALYRMYDVLWDETIADLEVDEGDNETWDLSAISQDASIYSLPGSPPSWLSITGASTDLVATTAPDVTADTNYDVVVRGTRSGINADETLRIVVRDTTPANNAPAFADASYTFTDVAIAVGEIIGTVAATDADNDTLSYSLTGTDADKFDIDSSGEITVAEALDYGETYSINVVADDGTDTTSVTVAIDAETVSPRAPTFVVDSTTEDSATITITAGDDGGESVSDWEYELDGDGTWVSFGNTDLEQTISNLDPETAYSIKVRGINSEGDGVASAAVTATTDAVVPLSIETIGDQELTLNSDYDIEIEILGDPDEVTVEGQWDDRVYYDWDAANDLLTISGNASTILSDAILEVTAIKGTETVEEDVIFSVSPPAPVITEPTNFVITAGTNYDDAPISIAIANGPAAVSMKGLLVGLYFEVTATGADIKGMLPDDVELTVTEGTVEISASTAGGEDTVTPSFTIN